MDTEQKMTRGSKIFFLILALLIVGSVGFTFWRIFIAKDYQIIAEVSCDTMTESCFFWEDEEGAYTYKMISKKASNIYACEQTEPSTPAGRDKIDCTEELSCLESEEDCEYIVCDPAELAEGEVCVGPGVEAEIEDEEEETEEILESEIMDDTEVIEEEPDLI
jgi:hypothetical protein